MTDSWEDWEKDDYEVPVLNIQQTEEQLKRFEERRLVEESDNALANELFHKKEKEKNVEEDLVYEDLKQKPSVLHKHDQQINVNKRHKTNKVNKNKENEQKQKALSNILKEEKARRKKEKELFGEAEYDDEYAEYEDKFY